MALIHAKVASRSCDDCRKYVYREDGELMRRPNTSTGLPVLRFAGQPTPCSACPKIPDDSPEKISMYARELTPKLWKTFQHYLECRAVGRFPEDPIVRRNARVIRDAMDSVDRHNQMELLLGLAKVTRKPT